jgi:integrase
MATPKPFRVGRVTVYPRGNAWYLRYHEHGRRRQVRGGTDKDATRQLAAQVNAQLEACVPAATSFEPLDIPELRRRWLDHHEHVLRSSVATVDRYRAASDHLLKFVRDAQPLKHAAHFRCTHAEAFVRHLRQLQVSPNGHARTAKRRLRDKGVKYILEVCRTLFGFALKRRHLPPYADNPFTAIQIDRIPIEDAKPITLLTAEQERRFLEACDDWQFPVFATLLLTGLRPGELTHLLLPDDVDLERGWLRVRNKPDLGWQVKTRNQRDVPLVPELAEILRSLIGGRPSGPVFRRRRFPCGDTREPAGQEREQWRAELTRRVGGLEASAEGVTRQRQRKACKGLWTELGVVREDKLRNEFMKLTKEIGLPHVTAPKTLRHMFATALQAVNVDPLIRNELMGHVAAGEAKGPLGMTAVYSHASPTTIRHQLEEALRGRPGLEVIRRWLEVRRKVAGDGTCPKARRYNP